MLENLFLFFLLPVNSDFLCREPGYWTHIHLLDTKGPIFLINRATVLKKDKISRKKSTYLCIMPIVQLVVAITILCHSLYMNSFVLHPFSVTCVNIIRVERIKALPLVLALKGPLCSGIDNSNRKLNIHQNQTFLNLSFFPMNLSFPLFPICSRNLISQSAAQ